MYLLIEKFLGINLDDPISTMASTEVIAKSRSLKKLAKIASAEYRDIYRDVLDYKYEVTEMYNEVEDRKALNETLREDRQYIIDSFNKVDPTKLDYHFCAVCKFTPDADDDQYNSEITFYVQKI